MARIRRAGYGIVPPRPPRGGAEGSDASSARRRAACRFKAHFARVARHAAADGSDSDGRHGWRRFARQSEGRVLRAAAGILLDRVAEISLSEERVGGVSIWHTQCKAALGSSEAQRPSFSEGLLRDDFCSLWEWVCLSCLVAPPTRPPPEISPGAWSLGTEPSALEVCGGELGRPEQCGQSR